LETTVAVQSTSDSASGGDPPKKNFLTTLWVSSTYFAEGFPYIVIRWLAGVYFTDIGMKEAVIGYTNWLGIPWNFKFVWAPLVDILGSRRAWLITMELILALLMGALAFLAGHGPRGQSGSSQPTQRLEWDELAQAIDPALGVSHQVIILAAVFVLLTMAFFAATHDVAIDGYYMEGIPQRSEQAGYSGLRVMWFRVAVIFVKFALVLATNWAVNFFAAAAVMFLLFAGHLALLPKFPDDKPRRANGPIFAQIGRAWWSFLQQPRIGITLAFIITYKLGDEILFSLNTTFLMRQLSVTKEQLSWLSGATGAITTIIGSTLGGIWIKRWGLKRALWPITLLMNLNIWVYVWIAWAKPQATTTGGLILIHFLHGYEQIAASLGNAALIVVILYTCKPEFKSAHYAIGSAIMSLGATVLGGFMGHVVEAIGYVNLFILSFVASLPSMAIIPFLPLDHLEEGQKS
jgi:MFS transporter, PAT family, beta-lactamase induction signal transducer AmpG